MSIDLLGPANAPFAVTVRPADTRIFSPTDTWFQPCSTPTADDGTEIDASYLNAMLAQLRHAIRGQGVTQNNADDDMLLKAIQSAGVRYGNDISGVADQIVVNFAYPLAVHTEGVPHLVKIANAVNGATTITRDGLSTLSVVHPDGSALSRGDWSAGGIGLVVFDGVNYQLLATWAQTRTSPLSATFTGLTGSASGGTKTAAWGMTEVIVANSVGVTRKLSSLNLTFDGSLVGPGGMASVAEPWPTAGDLDIYVIYNPTTGVAALVGANSPAGFPTFTHSAMPAGFTESAFICSLRTVSNTIQNFVQKGRKVYMLPFTVMSGLGGVAAYTLQSVAACIPNTAVAVSGMLLVGTFGPGGSTAGGFNARPCVACTSAGLGEQQGGGSDGYIGNYDSTLTFHDIPLFETQHIYFKWGTAGYDVAGAGASFLNISDYTI